MKQWTAQDVRMEPRLEISIGKNEDGEVVLTLVRGYRFVDGEGKNVPGLGRQRLVREVLWSNVSTDIEAAFAKLHKWTRNEALKEQEME